MRKKRERKRAKHVKTESSIDDVTRARLETVKRKREETIARVKQRLEEKFNDRFDLINANALKAERERQTLYENEAETLTEKLMSEIREEMKAVIVAGVDKVHAAKILHGKIKFDTKTSSMTIGSGKKYKLKNNVHAVGWGLEASMMISSLEKIIGKHLKKGFVVVARRTIASMAKYPEWFPKLDTHINYTEAKSDEIPDDVCVRATKNIADYCKKLKKKDILIVVLSRNSDDYLCLPKGKLGLGEKVMLLEELRNAGASLRDIGIVRKSLSAIRGNFFHKFLSQNLIRKVSKKYQELLLLFSISDWIFSIFLIKQDLDIQMKSE